MLSKEEIEQAKTFMVFYKNYCLNKEISNMKNYETVNDEEFVYKNIETILQYIDQLETKVKKSETDKQKLIDKLEKDIKKNNEFEFMPLQIEKAYNNYYKIGKIDLAQEILKVVKGEKK